MLIQPLRIGHFRICFGQLRHHLVGNAECGGIHHISAPQCHIKHATVTEITEIKQIALQPSHLATIFLTIVGQCMIFAIPQRECAGQHDRHTDAHRHCDLTSLRVLHALIERENKTKNADQIIQESPR